MNDKPMTKKLKIIIGIVTALIIGGLLAFAFSGDNYKFFKALTDKNFSQQNLRESLSSLGIRGGITVSILSMLQVVLTFLPAEPVQVIAGVGCGLWLGVLLCLIGVFVGDTLIYILYRTYGDKLAEFFEKNIEIDFNSAKHSSIVTVLVFILYLLPAIPYGLICYFSASLKMKYPKYILLNTLGAIPSICIGVGLGHIAIVKSWLVSLIVFIVLITLLLLMYRNKTALFKEVNALAKKHSNKNPSKTVVKKPNKAFCFFTYLGFRLFVLSKVKLEINDNVKNLKKPCIVLCNHGSFLDFAYTEKILREYSPQYVTARLYFYNKFLGFLLKKTGCFPKSMFSTDVENVKNCLTVIKNGGMLVMMPEARLSTVGKFEGIQDVTYKFIQKQNLPVYSLRMHGDYFVKPKWAKTMRRGGTVTCEFNTLFNENELKELPLERVKEQICDALYYDEFEWLKTRNDISYKSPEMAVGLENILFVCPSCKQKFTIQTVSKKVECSACGWKTFINEKYLFDENSPFENFSNWYDYQKQVILDEIKNDENFVLSDEVVLRHSSKSGFSQTRFSGYGRCYLSRDGLRYKGTEDTDDVDKFFPIEKVYRLLFGAGEDFEFYDGNEIYYFVPRDKRTCVLWYVVSEIMNEKLYE